MAILSLDTYLQETIQQNLNALLAKPYIIDKVLNSFNSEVRNNFKNKFCANEAGEFNTEIPVQFTFPRTKELQTAFILIQLEGAKEINEGGKGGSIGMLTGTGNSAKGDVQVTNAKLTVDKDKRIAYYTIPSAKEVISIQNWAGRYSLGGDKHERVFIPYAEYLETGMASKIFYIPWLIDNSSNFVEPEPTKLIGYDVQEVYSIDSVSQNMDTLRCLDAILRTIFIYMRNNIDEQVEYRLQSLSIQGTDLISEINNSTDSAFGNQLYYRRILAGYNTTYSVDVSLANDLRKLNLNPY